jgi:hypothetical protein
VRAIPKPLLDDGHVGHLVVPNGLAHGADSPTPHRQGPMSSIAGGLPEPLAHCGAGGFVDRDGAGETDCCPERS